MWRLFTVFLLAVAVACSGRPAMNTDGGAIIEFDARSGTDGPADIRGDIQGDVQGDLLDYPSAVQALYPANGHKTGSAHVLPSANMVDHPHEPKLVWARAFGAREYHLQLTFECSVESFHRCAFERPTVDIRTPDTSYRPVAPLPIRRQAPVGRRYYWRVRACNARGCSAFSTVRYLDVGRLPNDINGDGYEEVILRPNGDLSLYWGAKSGLGSPSKLASPPQFGDVRLWDAAFVGDVNGDGFADLVVTNSSRQVWFYFGSKTGPKAVPDLTLQGSRLPAPETITGVDINGDGFADVVLGESLHFGSKAGPSRGADLTLDHFGVVTAGDVNADGYPDLVIGRPQSDPLNAGKAYLYLGGPSGPKRAPNLALDNPTGRRFSHFGRSPSVGDIDGDGFADLAISAPFDDDRTRGKGKLYLHFGSPGGIERDASATLDNMGDAAFCEGLASADINRDGHVDVICSSYKTPTYLFYGSAGGLEKRPPKTLDSYGPHAASADVNGDGHPDIVIKDSIDYHARIHLGSPNGPKRAADITIP
jgi:hypothetical protein